MEFSFRFFLLLSIVLRCVDCFAQENVNQSQPIKITFHYNQNWELTTPENAVYKREAFFDLKDMMFDGIYTDYNKEGRMIGDGYYQRGEKSGLQTDYFEDQSVKASFEFSDHGFIIWQKMSSDKKFEVAKGTGKFSIHYFYFFDMRIKQGILHGEFLNGKRIGLWRYTDTGGKITDTEHYDDGKLMKHIFYRLNDSVSVNYGKQILLSVNSINTQSLAFDKNVFSSANDFFEKYIQYPSDFSRPISFPMGIKRLLTILSEELVIPERNLLIAKLKLDEHGKVLRVNLVRSVWSEADDTAIKLLNGYGHLFFPAILNGRPISAVTYLPVASGEEWMEMLRTMPTDYFTNISNFE